MQIPTHQLHVYMKPKIGADFIKAYPVQRYKHKISAMGGFDTASCQVIVARGEAETIYETFVGNRVAVYVDNPAAPIWEGLISRITFNLPGLSLTRSLDEMGNRVDVSARGVSATNPTLLGAINNTASQAIYGIKAKTLRAAKDAGGGTTYKTALENTMLALLAYPQSSVAPSTASPSAIIEVEMVGFSHTLEWEQASVAGFVQFFSQIAAVSEGTVQSTLRQLANGSTFLDNTDQTDLSINLALYNDTSDTQTVWQRLSMITECGDTSGNRWVCGVSPTIWQTSTRRFYYRAANLSVEYSVRLNDAGRIRTLSGTLVPPWTVRPDRVLRLTDALVGWDGTGSDPREAYLLDISYDADTQRITWGSDDSIEMQGALQVRRRHSANNEVYGQRATDPMM